MEIITHEGERSLLSYLDDLYTEGSRYRDDQAKGWDRAVDLLKGKVWPERRPAYKIDATLNLLEQIVEKKVAHLTDTRPTINIVATKRGLDPVCEMLTSIAEGVFEERFFERKLTEFIYLDQLFGNCYFKTPWDTQLDFGRGAIDIQTIDPRTFIFDPFVRQAYLIPQGEYCCMEEILPTDFLREQYETDKVKPDFTQKESSQGSVISKVRSMFQKVFNQSEIRTSIIPRSIKRDWWIRDRLTKGRDNKKAFPNWRHVVVAGGHITVDDSNPYIDGEMPFDGMDWAFNPDGAYGRNETGKLEMPQIMLNKLLAITIESGIYMANPIWIGDRDALGEKEWDRLNNEPGQHVRVRPGRTLRREAGVSLPSSLLQTLNLLAQGLRDLGGDTEAMSGKKPGQVTSGQGIESLQMAATTTIRLKARQIEYVIQNVGQKIISRAFQYLDYDRLFNRFGENDRLVKFEYERQKMKEALAQANLTTLNAHEFFQFKVTPASSLSMTKWQRGLIAVQLFQLGAIDREALLEAVEYPNREDILARTIEKQRSGEEPTGAKRGAKIPKQTLRATQPSPMQKG